VGGSVVEVGVLTNDANLYCSFLMRFEEVDRELCVIEIGEN
jgi:hypothetical protein